MAGNEAWNVIENIWHSIQFYFSTQIKMEGDTYLNFDEKIRIFQNQPEIEVVFYACMLFPINQV